MVLSIERRSRWWARCVGTGEMFCVGVCRSAHSQPHWGLPWSNSKCNSETTRSPYPLPTSPLHCHISRLTTTRWSSLWNRRGSGSAEFSKISHSPSEHTCFFTVKNCFPWLKKPLEIGQYSYLLTPEKMMELCIELVFIVLNFMWRIMSLYANLDLPMFNSHDTIDCWNECSVICIIQD